jgi:hypothetical protein
VRDDSLELLIALDLNTYSLMISFNIATSVMLRGIIPGDARYTRSDILEHIDEILINKNHLSYVREHETDRDGNELTQDTLFSQWVPDNYIKTRSMVLGGLMDGLSLRGKQDAVEKLDGSSLRSILCPIPIETISKILFARPHLVFEDVKEVLEPGKSKPCFLPIYLSLILSLFHL